MKVQPLHKRLIVQLEGTSNGKLAEYVSEGGIVIAGGDLSTGRNAYDGLKDRWALVLGVGSECLDVKVGDRVLITAGKWTEAVKLDGEYLWMTEEEQVLLIDDKFAETEGAEKTNALVM